MNGILVPNSGLREITIYRLNCTFICVSTVMHPALHVFVSVCATRTTSENAASDDCENRDLTTTTTTTTSTYISLSPATRCGGVRIAFETTTTRRRCGGPAGARRARRTKATGKMTKMDEEEGRTNATANRVLVVGGGRVGAYLARAFRAGGVETVVLKMSNRAETPGDTTRVAVKAIARDAGATVLTTYESLDKDAGGRHFDFVFVAVKTYALEAVKRELDEALITFDFVVTAHNGIVRPLFDESKSTRAVMPQSWDIIETPGVGCGYDIHVKNEDKPWVMPNTAGGRATRELLKKCGVLSVATDEFEYLLIRKYFINGVANLLAIVGDCNCDGLLTNHRARMDRLYEEMLNVLRVPHAAGFALAPENFHDVVFEGLATYRDHFPSTKLDFDEGAKLEIDSLNGYVIECAKSQGLPCDEHESLVAEVNALLAERDAAKK